MSLHTKELHDGILTVKLNRPEIHNAFNDELILELTKTFRSVGPDVRVVILRGEGKSFCAGADLNWMKCMKDYSFEENVTDAKALADLFVAINECPAPVIGVIHGAALGGGSGLVSVCDYVIAAETTTFGFTEAKLGLVPAVISPFVMAKIGESQARATFLSGRRFKAPEAKLMGLVHLVCQDALLEVELQNAIKEMMSAGPIAAREAKALVKGVLARNGKQSEQIDYTAQTIAKLRASAEGQEGMSALLEKRKPSWSENI